jgi:hypothetical protein
MTMVWLNTKNSTFCNILFLLAFESDFFHVHLYSNPSIVKLKWNGQMDGIVDKKNHTILLLEYS